MKITQEVSLDDVFAVVQSCNEHGHSPAFLEVTISAWRRLVHLISPTPRLEHPVHMFRDDCDDADCKQLRRLLRAKVGDEPGTLVGVPVRIVADPPPPIVARHDTFEEHVA